MLGGSRGAVRGSCLGGGGVRVDVNVEVKICRD